MRFRWTAVWVGEFPANRAAREIEQMETPAVAVERPTTPGASKLKLIELATIRSSRSVQSEKIGELAAGEFVAAHEECECDGHVRVRITPSPAAEQWISRVTGSGKQLAELQ